MIRLAKEYKKALALRARGYSLKEISQKLNISQSTVSLWCRNIKLTKAAKERLYKRFVDGSAKGIRLIKKRRQEEHYQILQKAQQKYSVINLNRNTYGLLCSIMYICEGTTNVNNGMHFINSDPKLAQLYLFLFRNSFNLDEKKFRVCVHLHSYHNKNKQLKYWSKITNIPLSQFIKPHQKFNTGKRIRENYQGCVSIRYYDNKISRELRNLYEIFLKDMRV